VYLDLEMAPVALGEAAPRGVAQLRRVSA